MEIIEVNGKKYIRQLPFPVSGVFRPISSEPITITKAIDTIKPIFICNGKCGTCIDKECFDI
jgi:hypothetical protein